MQPVVTSNLSNLAAQVEVERALVQAGVAVDNGLGLSGGDDTQTVISNSDEKMTVYSTTDGEPHLILKIDARRVLSKRLRDGRYAFWIPEMGGEAPKRIRGDVRCYLDPEFDESAISGMNAEWVNSIGLAGRVCNMGDPSKNIQRFKSAYDRDVHARTKHRVEWATIQEARERARQEKSDRDAREMREAMLALAGARAQDEKKPK